MCSMHPLLEPSILAGNFGSGFNIQTPMCVSQGWQSSVVWDLAVGYVSVDGDVVSLGGHWLYFLTASSPISPINSSLFLEVWQILRHQKALVVWRIQGHNRWDTGSDRTSPDLVHTAVAAPGTSVDKCHWYILVNYFHHLHLGPLDLPDIHLRQVNCQCSLILKTRALPSPFQTWHMTVSSHSPRWVSEPRVWIMIWECVFFDISGKNKSCTCTFPVSQDQFS